MASSPLSPKILKGGVVLLDPTSAVVQKIIPLQYNPETITRSLQPKRLTEGTDRSQALRLTAPPSETYSLEAEIDATDLLEVSDEQTKVNGLQPALAVLETIVYPTSSRLIKNNDLTNSGSLEIIPMESPLVLFIWSKNRIVPVHLTDFSITEEAFDPQLNPIRATISLSMEVLTVDNLGFSHKGGSLYLAYHRQKEQLAGKFKSAGLSSLGLNNI